MTTKRQLQAGKKNISKRRLTQRTLQEEILQRKRIDQAAALQRMMAAPSRALRAGDIEVFQRTVGNEAVQQLLRKRSEEQTAVEPTSRHPTGLILTKLFQENKSGAAAIPAAAKTVAKAIVSGTVNFDGVKVPVMGGRQMSPTFVLNNKRYVGGRPYGNREGNLDAKDKKGANIYYEEYDILPSRQLKSPYGATVTNRGEDRIVIGYVGGYGNPVGYYFTNNHYTDFTQFTA